MLRRLLTRFICAATLAASCAPSQADDFGAMAYSRSLGGATVALNRATRKEAELTALTSCLRKSRDCVVPVWVRNGCVAIARGRAHGYGSGWGSTIGSAEDEALAVCRNHARSCAIQQTACTGG